MLFKKKYKKNKLGLALGGGGARGFAHIAFLKVLDELGIKPAVISGTSIGALIGAVYAAGTSAEEIEKNMKSMGFVERIRLVDIWGGGDGLVKGRKIHSMLRDMTGNKNFDELDIPLKVIAADFWNSRQVVLEEGSVADAVRASMSIAGVFEPFRIDGVVLVDGGSVNPLPYDVLPDDCITAAVDVTGAKAPTEGLDRFPSIFECIFSGFQTLEITLIESKLRISRPDIYIKPAIENIGILDFGSASDVLASASEAAGVFRSELIRLGLTGSED